MSDRSNELDEMDTIDDSNLDSNDNLDDSSQHGRSRVGEAMHRDWEQTKSDLGMGGEDLNQDVDDTLGQAAGRRRVPPDGIPNPSDDARDDSLSTDSSALDDDSLGRTDR